MHNKKKIKQVIIKKEDQAGLSNFNALNFPDIYYYLNKKCDDSYDVITSLEEQILNEQVSREQTEKQYEKRLEDQRIKFSAEEVKLMTRIGDLEEKLKTFRDFGDKKEELEANVCDF